MLSDIRQIFISRHFKHPIDTVFSYWTEADLLKLWWAPPGYRVDDVKMNSVQSGVWRITMSPVEQGPSLTVIGAVEEIEPPSRLVLSWAWERPEGNSPSSTVEVLFTSEKGGTKVEISHGGIVPESAIPQHEAGWLCSVGQLAESLANA